MAKEKFQNFTSRLVPLRMDNVDTDQIIPARYLKATDKKGFGEHLFQDLRFNEDGTPKPDFPLNKPHYKGAQILLARENFGCGSSREHAPWALLGYGFKAIIAASFADIFRNNASKNGLLLIELPYQDVDQMHGDVLENPEREAFVNLAEDTLIWKGQPYTFPNNPFTKKMLLEGLDDIGYTLSFAKDIDAFEKNKK
ncbi:3-isopropylmalate dehydratase small subunit [Candidatus Kaiserbacteria bacterium RIFCSPHIGHO2_02_FULL_59_21]|uniref:3-isopropylmalate dehydratase small subunit n=2 Tax=Candidatus Kaiseribacteriota TaxID=1752734 RepID=A0A0G2BPN2_9BACT|nr:MAG: 3-isopropylmalate dehydratase small subunit [Candidatus Kaiserbacteria bacterium GW2011_GWA2_58_9]OGG61598.1 MAG: 3-isopropylmalate dehydratase small subunit [Candidatus Kaiserbacteria bacterium RIFCSPHIGHO2_01_FULL_58_22]OGG66872.1 MAG: 3-isopropylmalate dehydratase small subunit [Candidatus Kaiserbacteria bacterium RIFCSPHIGHO2_02_FULL_59_21]